LTRGRGEARLPFRHALLGWASKAARSPDVAHPALRLLPGLTNTSVETGRADEKQSHDQLVKEWEQFAADIKSSCTQESTNVDGIRSNAELLTCLQIARDASKLPNK
jgi:hypothetical protein